jgi:hypothetical protein
VPRDSLADVNLPLSHANLLTCPGVLSVVAPSSHLAGQVLSELGTLRAFCDREDSSPKYLVLPKHLGVAWVHTLLSKSILVLSHFVCCHLYPDLVLYLSRVACRCSQLRALQSAVQSDEKKYSQVC